MDKYLTVLFTDTHFGTKQNSMTWFKYQRDFIESQLIPHILKRRNEGYKVRLIHCGDVFDSRSTINSYIATHVVAMFEKIINVCDKFYIVLGNHDFFSPETDSVDTVSLIFEQLRLKNENKFVMVSKECLVDRWGDETSLFVPWYEWLNNQDYIKSLIDTHHPSHLFTHADLMRDRYDLNCPNIVSGHIHTPIFEGNIKNLGSCYPLTFIDANQKRGFYEYEDGGELKFIENEKSIRYWRFYDKEVLSVSPLVEGKDYIELYITKKNLLKKNYSDSIQKWSNKFKNLWVIPQVDIDNDSSDIQTFEGYNIEKLTEELIPVELRDKFERVKQYINNIKD